MALLLPTLFTNLLQLELFLKTKTYFLFVFLGIVLNLLGGGLYSYAKYEETNLRPLCAMPNSARSVMNGLSSNGAKGNPSRSVAISVEDLMASRVVKIKSDNDRSDYPRKIM